MDLFEALTRLMSRFRYPVSLPEDVARDLGMHLPNTLAFYEFLRLLSSPHHRPSKIRKFMQRKAAEEMFESAIKREFFKSCSLFSYYFNKGWLVFALYYDQCDRLRRVHLQCPATSLVEGFDLALDEEHALTEASSH